MKWEAKLAVVAAGVMALGVAVIILLFPNIPELSQVDSAGGILIGLVVAIPCILLIFWLIDKWDPT